MKTFIIAVLTADGFIAERQDQISTDWTSKEDRKFFSERTKQAGVIVMGLNTYKTIGRPLPDRLNIVYSTSAENIEGVEVTKKSPKDLLEELEKRGYGEVAICGGTSVFTMFMQEGLVDKLYLSIEPVAFGSGLTMFNKAMNVKLEFVCQKTMGESTVLLEYNVIR